MKESQASNMSQFPSIKIEAPFDIVKYIVTKPAYLAVRITNCGELVRVQKSFEVQAEPDGWILAFGNECPSTQTLLSNKRIHLGSEFVFPEDFPVEQFNGLERQLPLLMEKALERLNHMTLPIGSWSTVGNKRLELAYKFVPPFYGVKKERFPGQVIVMTPLIPKGFDQPIIHRHQGLGISVGSSTTYDKAEKTLWLGKFARDSCEGSLALFDDFDAETIRDAIEHYFNAMLQPKCTTGE